MKEKPGNWQPLTWDKLLKSRLKSGSDNIEVIHPTKGREKKLRLIAEVVCASPLYELTYNSPRGIYINHSRGTFTIAFEENNKPKYATFRKRLNHLSFGYIED